MHGVAACGHVEMGEEEEEEDTCMEHLQECCLVVVDDVVHVEVVMDVDKDSLLLMVSEEEGTTGEQMGDEHMVVADDGRMLPDYMGHLAIVKEARAVDLEAFPLTASFEPVGGLLGSIYPFRVAETSAE